MHPTAAYPLRISPRFYFSLQPNVPRLLRLLSALLSKIPMLRRAAAKSAGSALAWALVRPKLSFLRVFERRIVLVRRWHAAAAGALIFKAVWWAVKKFSEHRRVASRARALRQRMKEADSCDSWSDAAAELDQLEGRVLPLAAFSRELSSMAVRADQIERMRQADDVHGLMWTLRQMTSRPVAHLLSSLAEECRMHVFRPSEEVLRYVQEVQRALHHVCHARALPLEERLNFVRELRHAYGRTGLVLSGGGSFSNTNFGIIKELFIAGLLPRVVSGSSGGAIAGAMLCTRSDAELTETMDTWIQNPHNDFFGEDKTPAELLSHYYQKGTLHAVEDFLIRLKRLLGDDLTFQEAYARSGRILNIAITAHDTKEPNRVLNYLTAPNVLVWSAVACSSAFPLLFAPQELLVKKPTGEIVGHYPAVAGTGRLRRWCDGSLQEDLPMRCLSEIFGVNFFLVSQCNPWLLPILAARQALPVRFREIAELEVKHRCEQLLQLFPGRKILRLIAQPWRGDLNFVLPLSTFPLLRSAVNFTAEEMTTAMREGQRSVWAKLSAVRVSCAIEVALDSELLSLTMQSKALRRREEHVAALSSRIRASLPSWMDLKSLGLAHSESLDELLQRGPSHDQSMDKISELAGMETAIAEGKLAGVGTIAEESAAEAAAMMESGGSEEVDRPDEPWESPGVITSGSGGGGSRVALEGGWAVWQDLSALTLVSEGLAP